jgi:hypothetical protein
MRQRRGPIGWLVEMFICIYCGSYSGPYADVQAHQATCDARK